MPRSRRASRPRALPGELEVAHPSAVTPAKASPLDPPPSARRRRGDGEVLDGEAGRVEDRDLVLVAAALLLAGEDAAELGDVLALQPVVEGVRDLAVVARLLPLVANDAGAQELLDGDLRLARPVGAHEAHVLARRGGSRCPGRGSRSRA